MCGQFISNGYVPGNCPSMSCLRQDRHNGTIQLLRTLLQQSNEGRWETITAGFNSKPIQTFTTDRISGSLSLLCGSAIQHSQMTTRIVDADEGLDYSSLFHCPANLPEDILPTHLRTLAHKFYLIRLLGPRLEGRTSSRRRCSSIRKIQMVEWKYCTDSSLKDTHHHIIEKYTPVANALRSHWSGT
jgi:hypothetical protein